MVNIQNFYILKESGFIETYKYIHSALDYYYNDPKICCRLFRDVLESLLTDIYCIIGETKPEKNNDAIENLYIHLVEYVNDCDNILSSLNRLRCVTNQYNHININRNVQKDRLICYQESLNISRWIVDFCMNYSKYKEEINEDNNKFLKRCFYALSGLAVIYTLFTTLKNLNDDK